jgi:hypothetical protein
MVYKPIVINFGVYLLVWNMEIINVNPKSGAKLWAQKAEVWWVDPLLKQSALQRFGPGWSRMDMENLGEPQM